MRIAFVHQHMATFVEKDFQILKEKHSVRDVHFRGLRDLPRLLNELRRCDIVFCWFGKLHAFFAVLFSKALGRKTVVVSGGDEVAKDIIGGQRYGLCAHPMKRWFVHFIFAVADLGLAVSKSNLGETLQNAKAKPEKTKLIYHGFDASKFRCLEGVAKEDLVFTVVTRITEEIVRLKSLKLFLDCARLLPETAFAIVGPVGDGSAATLRQASPSNVVFTGGLYGEELIAMMNRASVYVQASEWESFGCALAEAMLCECVPVVSRRTSLPEVVGGCGYYIDRLDPRELARAVRQALRDGEMGGKARERIASLFPLEERRKALLEAVESVARR